MCDKLRHLNGGYCCWQMYMTHGKEHYQTCVSNPQRISTEEYLSCHDVCYKAGVKLPAYHGGELPLHSGAFFPLRDHKGDPIQEPVTRYVNYCSIGPGITHNCSALGGTSAMHPQDFKVHSNTPTLETTPGVPIDFSWTANYMLDRFEDQQSYLNYESAKNIIQRMRTIANTMEHYHQEYLKKMINETKL